MKPNILFILVDGLRSDQCYGDSKDSTTPFIDSLINSGVYFSKAFSPADGTIISLNCLFNSKFQFETGIRAKKVILKENNHLEVLQNSKYHIVGLIPKLTSLIPISEYFQNENYFYEPGPPPETLSTGILNRILNILDSIKNRSPWFFYIHLFDLHPLREGRMPLDIDEFKSEKFGKSSYGQTVSAIDHWLKKINEKINFDNTILVLTADHGERIPFGGKASPEFEPKLKNLSSTGKKILPESTHKIGGKVLGKIKHSIGQRKLNSSNRDLTSYQKRSKDPHFTLSLYDELIRIPFLLRGKNIPSKIISNQVCNLDIFPTIFHFADIPFNNTQFAQNLFPLIDRKLLPEKNIFLHTIPYEKESELDKIGIRTENFKYFRHARDPMKNISLFNLKNDPFENNNIAKAEPNIVQRMEKFIHQMTSSVNDKPNVELTMKEENEIEKELRKLGYM